MTIAIHQPNYLPWLGYFYKIYASDVFVFHDAVEFSKASYTKRCKIRQAKFASETTWLSVPVKDHSTGSLIADILIEDHQWVTKHFKKIENTYAAALHFDEYVDWLKQTFHTAQAMQSLAAMNMYLIREVALKLALNSTYCRSSDITVFGKGTALNLAIAKQLRATTYLAGAGSLNYQDDDAFRAESIETVHHDLGAWLTAHPYEQGTGQFTGGLSVIDALMHTGVEGIREMFQKYKAEQKA